MAKSTPELKQRGFLQGRLFELILCILAVLATVTFGLTVPLNTSADNNQAAQFFFVAWGSIAVVTALLTRHIFLKSRNLKPKDPDPIKRTLFIWLLPVVIYIAMTPWIFSGALTDEDMNAVGASILIIGLGYGSLMAGIILAAAIAPFEMFLRGIIKLVTSRGKEGVGAVVVGLYLILVVGFIAVGFNAATTQLTGSPAHVTLLLALFGLPGEYLVKSEPLLWLARLMGAVIVVTPFIYAVIQKKHGSNRIVKDIESRIA